MAGHERRQLTTVHLDQRRRHERHHLHDAVPVDREEARLAKGHAGAVNEVNHLIAVDIDDGVFHFAVEKHVDLVGDIAELPERLATGEMASGDRRS